MSTILVALIVLILSLSVWGLWRVRAARREILAALMQLQREVVVMDRRFTRLGPFAGTTSRSQLVYRIETRGAAGDRGVVWARWGRGWLMRPDTLELKWDA